MKTIQAILLSLITIALVLTGCSQPANQQKIKTIDNVDVDSLKEKVGTYVGDNSKVNEIVQGLAGGETVKEIDLSGERIKVSYGYEENSQISEEQVNEFWFNGKNIDKQNFYYNAIYLTLLVPNAKGYEFDIDESSVKVDREQIEKKLKDEFKDYPDLKDGEAVQQFIEKNESKFKELASEEYQAFQ
ncbi:DUF4825 domain-containing protein [Rossellomorea aquimaris]|uniref:DUF4825 domain-containing protein n=1 Tax=Rossellomorea aquimaris TaxID=189382 RepID=UPI001CD38DC3|nr:DUF4825 domain-containing protein [Rossellomorea aquimaris]MCA1055890.1 DUF4825 domain-containing protein [Rossellomorea aquimaris]